MTIRSRAAAEKQRLRRELRAARRALDTATLSERARRVRRAAARLPDLVNACAVAGYVANDGEIDVTGILEDCRRRGAAILLPRLRGDGALDLVPMLGTYSLRATGPGGLLEPVGDPLPPERLPRAGFLLAPAVALDRSGARLGRGGGAYDRLIATLRERDWRIAAVSHASAILADLPVETHDQRVDLLLSDAGSFRADAALDRRTGATGELLHRATSSDTEESDRPSGILLAGGRSQRMGRPKALVELAGEPLVRHVARALLAVCDDVVLVLAPEDTLPPGFARDVHSAAAGGDRAAIARIAVVHDPAPHLGPVGGLARGLASVRREYALAAGCDAPLLSPALLAALWTYARRTPGLDAVLPVWGERLQPLVALYRRESMRALFESQIARDALRPTEALDQVDYRTIDETALREIDPEGASFVNLNTPDDLLRARRLLAQRAEGLRS